MHGTSKYQTVTSSTKTVGWAGLPSMNLTPNIALHNNIRESGFVLIGMLVLDMAYEP